MNGKFARRSTGVRVLTLVLAFVLVMGASVAGTLAWLTAETDEVINTFTSAELFANAENFTLWEHQAVLGTDGTYTLNATETKANTYDILPGVNIPKDPTVDVVGLQAHAYLYIKVTDALPAGLSYTIDSTNWEKLSGYEDIYVFKGNYAEGKAVENNVIPATDAAPVTFLANILTQNNDGTAITVAGNYNITTDTGLTLSFDAYMVQATGTGTAIQAWELNYPAVGNKTPSNP